MATRSRSGGSEPERVVSTWRMLEQFNPQNVPKLEGPSRDSRRQTIRWTPGTDLPWDTLTTPPRDRSPKKSSKPQSWHHTVYLGVYPVSAIYDILLAAFEDAQDAYDPRAGSNSACVAMTVGADGRLDPASCTLSAALWGVGRALDPGPAAPRWLDGFDAASDEVGEKIERFLADRRRRARAEEPPPMDSDGLSHLVELVQRVSGISTIPDLATAEVLIQSTYRADSEGDQTDFLNSFVLEDLQKVQAAVRRKEVGNALREYLAPDSELPSPRVDVIESPQAVDALLTPDRIPGGRWPADPAHPLALSQQFAVGRAVRDLHGRSGLLAVNGPPGTGKTTMLRDVLAGLVVERARVLATLRSARDAFEKVPLTWETNTTWTQRVFPLKPKITGFEMVVASANNGAVENVSREMPSRDKIDGVWRESADYFSELTSVVLDGDEPSDHEGDVPEPARVGTSAWGLIAAQLGKKEHRTTFANRFWWGSASSDAPTMQDHLRAWKSEAERPRSWSAAKKAFRSAEHAVDRLIAEREAAAERAVRFAGFPERTRRLRAQHERASQELAVAEEQYRATFSWEQERAQTASSDRQHADRHLELKPSWWSDLISWGRAGKEWRDRHEELVTAWSASHDAAQNAGRHRAAAEQRCSAARVAVRTAERDLATHQRTASDLARSCDHDRAKYGAAYPGTEGTEREKQAPWLDAELDQARSALFLAALDLHRDLMANAPGPFHASLGAAMAVLQGKAPRDLDPATVRAAWQVLFLAVPLVSTTFASVPRMFGGLGREALGWLFIDEAGQATPQLAAGAIWRFERVLAVGDPLQLEPIMTIPPKLTLNIAATYQVGKNWLPPSASVQTLCDRMSPYGTYLGKDEDTVWVGSPLRIHRRCDDPMFSISNTIAYDGLMVSAVPGSREDPENPFSPQREGADLITASYWADRPATSADDAVQPAEIDACRAALAYLIDQKGVPAEEIMVVSPFRAVANRLQALKSERPDLTAGTIHVSQGKQADVVIFVLGGARDRPGSKAWAASSPNLVNVAVSRAKRRLYVIGDHERWKEHRFFSDMARALPRRGMPGVAGQSESS